MDLNKLSTALELLQTPDRHIYSEVAMHGVMDKEFKKWDGALETSAAQLARHIEQNIRLEPTLFITRSPFIFHEMRQQRIDGNLRTEVVVFSKAEVDLIRRTLTELIMEARTES